jgi:hypothetical protein
LISECGGCKVTHFLDVKTCTACNVACDGCTGLGNDKCITCSTSGVIKYKKHDSTGKCLEIKCGNKENFFIPVAGKLFCDVGSTATGLNADGC